MVAFVPDDELSFTVSAREIYDKVSETAQLVREIKDGRVDHETRIRALERWRYAAGGGIALACVALGWLITLKAGGSL